MKIAALISGGKDSWYAAYQTQKEHKLACLITLKPEKEDSWMFHFPNIDFVEKQAKSAQLPLIQLTTKGEKEKELKDLEEAIKLAQKKYNIKGLVSGALASTYQKERINKLCQKLNLKSFTPLWHIQPENYMKRLILDNFKTIIVGIAADGLTKDWLGKEINNQTLQKLKKISQEHQFNLHGEGGEYETFILDCPLFKKEIIIKEAKKQLENKNTGRLFIKKVKLKVKITASDASQK